MSGLTFLRIFFLVVCYFTALDLLCNVYKRFKGPGSIFHTTSEKSEVTNSQQRALLFISACKIQWSVKKADSVKAAKCLRAVANGKITVTAELDRSRTGYTYKTATLTGTESS